MEKKEPSDEELRSNLKSSLKALNEDIAALNNAGITVEGELVIISRSARGSVHSQIMVVRRLIRVFEND